MSAKILVADDSDTIQTAVQLTFSREDVDLIPARNGEEAIQRAKEAGPDLMLIDTVMPDKSGYEVCRALRAEPALQNVPIIMLSGPSDVADTSEWGAAGASDVIGKPFGARELIGKVRRHLDAPSQHQPVPADVRLELTRRLEELQGSTLGMIPPLVRKAVSASADSPTSPAPASLSTDQQVPTYVLEESSSTPEAPSIMERVELPPHLIGQAVREAAERAFTQISKELRDVLMERIEQTVREVVPALAESLIVKEIERIKASVKEHTTA